jgi:hypothetical protein
MRIGKRLLAVAAILFFSAGSLSAQWRADVAQLFAKGRDYKTIVGRLQEAYGSFESLMDKADAAGLLAFGNNKLADAKEEMRWIFEYFETCRQQDSGYAFLDLVSQADVVGWLNVWKGRYPFVREVALVRGVGDQPLIPAGILPLVVDISHEAFYKFSRGASVLEGGEFQPGFNIIALDANELLLTSGTRVYELEIKSGGLVLRKEITLDVQVTAPPQPPQPAPQPGQVLEYTLSMYIGGELVMTSRKVEYPIPWGIDVKPNTLPVGFKPDWVLHRNEPNVMNSFSIVQALSMIYSLLKDLLKKKAKPDAEPPKIQTVQDLSLTFKQKDAAGQDRETKVSLKLRTKNLSYVLAVP